MITRGFWILLASLAMLPAQALAQTATHPIWATTPGTALDALARAQFEDALKKRGLGPLEAVEVAQTPTPQVLGKRPAALDMSADDETAAIHARAKGAAFALLGHLHLVDKGEIGLRLVDAQTGHLHDSIALALTTDTTSPDLVAAVLRLDEMASRADLLRRTEGKDGKPKSFIPLAAPPPRAELADSPTLRDNTQGWLRQHWPLLTAVGVAVGTAVVLGIVVASDSGRSTSTQP